jgi:hypothetical protein
MKLVILSQYFFPNFLRSREGFWIQADTELFIKLCQECFYNCAFLFRFQWESFSRYCSRKGPGHEGSDSGVLDPARQGEGGGAGIDFPLLPPSLEDNPPEGIPGVGEASCLPGSSRLNPAALLQGLLKMKLSSGKLQF